MKKIKGALYSSEIEIRQPLQELLAYTSRKCKITIKDSFSWLGSKVHIHQCRLAGIHVADLAKTWQRAQHEFYVKISYFIVFLGINRQNFEYDARIFRNSSLSKAIGPKLIGKDNHLIADPAYKLLAQVLTPFRNRGQLEQVITVFVIIKNKIIMSSI